MLKSVARMPELASSKELFEIAILSLLNLNSEISSERRGELVCPSEGVFYADVKD